MFCKYCGNEMDDNSKFCPNCGREIDTGNFIVPTDIAPNNNANFNNTNKEPNPTVVHITNEIKKDDEMSCMGCLGYIFLLIIILSILGSCVA